MLESRMFAPSCIVKNSKLGANIRLSSMFPYKSLRNGYHELSLIYSNLNLITFPIRSTVNSLISGQSDKKNVKILIKKINK